MVMAAVYALLKTKLRAGGGDNKGRGRVQSLRDHGKTDEGDLEEAAEETAPVHASHRMVGKPMEATPEATSAAPVELVKTSDEPELMVDAPTVVTSTVPVDLVKDGKAVSAKGRLELAPAFGQTKFKTARIKSHTATSEPKASKRRTKPRAATARQAANGEDNSGESELERQVRLATMRLITGEAITRI